MTGVDDYRGDDLPGLAGENVGHDHGRLGDAAQARSLVQDDPCSLQPGARVGEVPGPRQLRADDEVLGDERDAAVRREQFGDADRDGTADRIPDHHRPGRQRPWGLQHRARGADVSVGVDLVVAPPITSAGAQQHRPVVPTELGLAGVDAEVDPDAELGTLVLQPVGDVREPLPAGTGGGRPYGAAGPVRPVYYPYIVSAQGGDPGGFQAGRPGADD